MWSKVLSWFQKYWMWIVFPLGILFTLLKIFSGGKADTIPGSFDQWITDKEKVNQTVGEKIQAAETKAKNSDDAAEKVAQDEKSKAGTVDGLRDSLGDKFGRDRQR